MGIDLYYDIASPSCVSVMLVAKALGIELNLIPTDLQNGDQFTPEFTKLNPQQLIPTLVDNNFSLGESRAIMIYLVEKYGKDDQLYSKIPKDKAIINQRLFFDIGTLYTGFESCCEPIIFQGKNADEASKIKLLKALDVLETFLDFHAFVAGPDLTIVDLSIVVEIAVLEILKIVDIPKKYPNIDRWFQQMKKTVKGYDEILQQSVDKCKLIMESI